MHDILNFLDQFYFDVLVSLLVTGILFRSWFQDISLLGYYTTGSFYRNVFFEIEILAIKKKKYYFLYYFLCLYI